MTTELTKSLNLSSVTGKAGGVLLNLVDHAAPRRFTTDDDHFAFAWKLNRASDSAEFRNPPFDHRLEFAHLVTEEDHRMVVRLRILIRRLRFLCQPLSR